jgi:hypothetical protein
MAHTFVTIKVWGETVKVLDRIRAETRESRVELLCRLALKEWKRIQKEKDE